MKMIKINFCPFVSPTRPLSPDLESILRTIWPCLHLSKLSAYSCSILHLSKLSAYSCNILHLSNLHILTIWREKKTIHALRQCARASDVHCDCSCCYDYRCSAKYQVRLFVFVKNVKVTILDTNI